MFITGNSRILLGNIHTYKYLREYINTNSIGLVISEFTGFKSFHSNTYIYMI